MGDWRPNGIVTLLTDFGSRDPYVGILKGVLLGAAPGLRHVVDLTHDVEAQDVDTASFFLANAWRWFPPGTVHVAVVDPGVGSERPILVVEAGGHALLAPDNGLLAETLRGAQHVRVGRAEPARLGIVAASRTFHGRDLFAPLAARLVEGASPEELTGEATSYRDLPLPPSAPVRRPDGVLEGRVRLVDRFGNLITNVAPEGLGSAAGHVEISGTRVALRETYADVAPGELVALVDSYRLLEVAERDGSAARTLGVGVGEPALLHPAG